MTEVSTPPSKSGMPGFVVILLIAAAFVVGMLWNRLQSLEKQVADLKGGTPVVNNQPAGGQAANAGNNPVGNTAPAVAQAGLEQAGEVEPVTDQDHIRGKKDAQIVLIEYSDFQCPYCKQFHPTVQRVVREYGDKVAWVYRHFPLIQIHPYAQKAAEASECVAELGGNEKFWEYADELFAGTGLTDDDLTNAATKVGVNKASFSTCLSSGKHAQRVNADAASGQKAGVSGTPGTIILTKDGKKQLIPGALPYEQIKSAIDGML